MPRLIEAVFFAGWIAALHAVEPVSVAPVAPVSARPGGVGFSRLAPESTGILFTNLLSPQRASQNQVLLNGSGVAAGDVDGDGQCDLFFCSLEGDNKLYRNLGNWRFEDVTSEAGLSARGQLSTGAVFLDVDGDGDLDLLVNSIRSGTQLFLNDGRGHFTAKPLPNPSPARGSTSFAVADIDGDGDLDVYVVNYRSDTIRSTGFPTINVNGRKVLPPEYKKRLEITSQGLVFENGEPDVLYLNAGDGRLEPAVWTDGRFLDERGMPLASAPLDWGLSALFYDINLDGAPDLYVCNDFHSPDRFWLNDGLGHFRSAPALALRNTPTFSMSVDMADFDRDGTVDFLSADMLAPTQQARLCQVKGSEEAPVGEVTNRVQVERNTLQRGRGDGTFEEVAQYHHLEGTGWSWSVAFLDVDLDGYEDLLVTSGNLFNTQDMDATTAIDRGGPYSREMIPEKLLKYPPLAQAKGLFRNVGGKRFQNMEGAWGFNDVGIAQGMCFADLDNDGDLDVAVNQLNGAAGIYRNESTSPRVAVRLRGEQGNTRGIGAKIELSGGSLPVQRQEMICGGRYLSGDDTLRVFAVGERSEHLRLTVTWRNGRRTVLDQVRPDAIYTVAEAGSSAPPSAFQKKPGPWFEDTSASIHHRHHEEAFDDFARQGLLPRKLSQLGPGVAWSDVNNDGKEDLLIASGRGGTLSLLENRGAFQPSTNALFNAVATRDQTTVLAIKHATGPLRILAGLANYEDGQTNGAALQEYNLQETKVRTAVSASPFSPGPLAVADVDADGQLDLFVGGRVLPAGYPLPASSRLFHDRNGEWALDLTNTAVLGQVGLVSGAVWTDLDGDGYPELVLACEWGPLRIFANRKGVLHDATSDWKMTDRIGWWNGVSAGDFDGDGRMDLIASNWGLNTRYQVREGHGPRIYYGAWGSVGQIEPLEAVYDASIGQWIPERDLTAVGNAIPAIREQFQTHRAYALAGVDAILGSRAREARVLEANWLETTVFLNRGDHFELGHLPIAAQFSPAFGVNVADFDGDGHEDLFLSQNFFAVQPQASRNDAGRGLLLKGDGRGNFERVDGAESGIKVYGEQRGSAVADYDNDGRTDLVVTQNGAETCLFHNIRTQPGLRVRLQGKKGNVQAFGAILRIGFSMGWGPAREVHGGSGYWSQDSAVQVMALPAEAQRIQVLWPGGDRREMAVPPGAREIGVDQESGTLRVVR